MKCRQSSAYRLLEILMDEILCPMVDRIPSTLSSQCIGQQIMLDIMDAKLQLARALFSPKGEPRIGFISLVQLRMEDLQSNVASLRARTKRYEKIEASSKPARIVTAKQYSAFLQQTAVIFTEINAMLKSSEEYAAKAAAAALPSEAAGTTLV